MDFFEHQDVAKSQSARLIWLLLLSILMMTAVINGVIFFMIWEIAKYDATFAYMLYEPWWVPSSLLIIFIVAVGTIIRSFQIRKGGQTIAHWVGARPLGETGLSFKEKQLRNIVDEMAIASGTPAPLLYVLDQPSINAFVAGKSAHDSVMVVTQGAIEAFTRDEMQAVVGHEFSHLHHSDIKINLRLIGLLGGILAIGQVGTYVMYSMRYSRTSRGGSSSGGGILAIILIGLVMTVVGYIGLFFGRLIKASISRKRELLADASAVQYTRNPHALVSAFKTMQAHEKGTTIQSTHSEDVNHLCFAPAVNMFFGKLLASHPPLDYRIAQIDPIGQYDRLPRQQTQESTGAPTQKSSQVSFDFLGQNQFIVTTAALIMGGLNQPSDAHMVFARKLRGLIDTNLRDVCANPEQKGLLLVALFCYVHDDKKRANLEAHFSPQQTMIIDHQIEVLETFKAYTLIEIIDYVWSGFATLELTQQKDTIAIMSTFYPDSMNFVQELMLIHLYEKVERVSFEHEKHLTDCQFEVQHLLERVVGESDIESYKKDIKLDWIMSQLGFESIAPTPDPIPSLQSMFQTLNQLTDRDKQRLFEPLVDILVNEEKIKIRHVQALRLMGEILEIPIPPVLPEKVLAEL